jgi:peptidoglycan/LPS O-acetylase OafA/YrhL
MVVSGTLAALKMAARGSAPQSTDPAQFLMIPLSDMALFGGFVAAALVRRRNREAHKRLMLLAYVCIVVAAVARLPGVLQLGPPVFFGLTFVFVLAGVIYDMTSRGRIHPVYAWGGTLLVISVPVRLVIAGTDGWKAFARWAIGFV